MDSSTVLKPAPSVAYMATWGGCLLLASLFQNSYLMDICKIVKIDTLHYLALCTLSNTGAEVKQHSAYGRSLTEFQGL